MKRKLVLALIAILAIGLLFVGCPTGEETTIPGIKGPDTGGGLKPWAPAQIAEPTGYESFPKGENDGTNKDGLLGWSSVWTGGDNPGWIEEGETDGTYKVTAKTNPNGTTLITFQDDDVQYKTGFYLSLELPTATEAKPMGMIAYPAKGMQEAGAQWNLAQYINLNTDLTPVNNGVYLAGRVDIKWENERNPWPLRTICLRIYWRADEKADIEYEFKVRKILIPEDDDLSEPAYPAEVWPYDPIPAPTAGWKDFPSASITGATYSTSAESGKPVTITTVTNGYSITIPAYPAGHTEITFPATTGSEFTGGYYISLALPENATDALRPVRVYAYPNAYWNGAVDLEPDVGYFVGGNVDMLWDGEPATPTTLDTINIQFHWHTDEPDNGSYTFILKKLMITSDEIVVPEYPGVVTGVKAYLQETATWGGAWGNAYEDIPNTKLSIDFTSELATATAYDQFVLDLTFPVEDVGKSYQFTLSDLNILDSSNANTITEAEILAGFRGGNDGNGWAQQQNVVTKLAANTYRVKMTVIAGGGAGLTRLVINRASSAAIAKYGFKALLPKGYALEQATPPTVTVPTAWVDFPGSETLTATYYPWATSSTGKTINAVYSPTDSARTLVRLSGTTFQYQKGIYLSVTLPNNSLQPSRIIAYPSTTDLEGGIAPGGDWNISADVEAPEGKYLAGKVDFKWEKADSAHIFKGIILDIYWAEGQVAGSYSFTIDTIQVAEKYESSGPVTLEPWAPPTASKPASGLTALTEAQLLAMTTIPAGGTITKNTDDTYAVKVKARTEGNTRIYFTTTTAFGSVFMSATFPETDTLQPSRIILGTATDAAENGFAWGTAQGGEAPTGKYLAGDVGLLVTNAAKTFYTAVIYLYIPLLPADDFYEFTLKDLSVEF